MTCDICGVDTPQKGVAIMVCYGTGEDSDYPFIQLTLCGYHLNILGGDGMLRMLNEIKKERK